MDDNIKYQYISIIVSISRGEGYGMLQDPCLERFGRNACKRECPNLVDRWQLTNGMGMGWINAGEDFRLTCSGTV